MNAKLHLRRNGALHGQAAALDGDHAAGGVHDGAGQAVPVPSLFPRFLETFDDMLNLPNLYLRRVLRRQEEVQRGADSARVRGRYGAYFVVCIRRAGGQASSLYELDHLLVYLWGCESTYGIFSSGNRSVWKAKQGYWVERPAIA